MSTPASEDAEAPSLNPPRPPKATARYSGRSMAYDLGAEAKRRSELRAARDLYAQAARSAKYAPDMGTGFDASSAAASLRLRTQQLVDSGVISRRFAERAVSLGAGDRSVGSMLWRHASLAAVSVAEEDSRKAAQYKYDKRKHLVALAEAKQNGSAVSEVRIKQPTAEPAGSPLGSLGGAQLGPPPGQALDSGGSEDYLANLDESEGSWLPGAKPGQYSYDDTGKIYFVDKKRGKRDRGRPFDDLDPRRYFVQPATGQLIRLKEPRDDALTLKNASDFGFVPAAPYFWSKVPSKAKKQ